MKQREIKGKDKIIYNKDYEARSINNKKKIEGLMTK